MSGSLVRTRQTLIDIRKILKMVHRVCEIPIVVRETLLSIRDTVICVRKILSSMRATKKFLDKVIVQTFAPSKSQGRVIIAPCHKKVIFAPSVL